MANLKAVQHQDWKLTVAIKQRQDNMKDIPLALECFVWIAADSEDVNHLHPVVGQWQRQLDVVRGLEPGVRQAVEHFVAVIKCN